MKKNSESGDTNTLLIYEMFPESVSTYLIPNSELTPEGLKALELAQDMVVNSDDLTEEQRAACTLVGDALSEKKEHCEKPDNALACAWVKYKTQGVVKASITQVFRTGFAL